MLQSVKRLHGYAVRAMDGDMGKVDDFYFDDHTWTIRYLVANTGDWLSDRRVLLSTAALGCPLQEQRLFPVSLTREQVKKSPDIDTEKPVSRQKEEELHRYYGWTPYWGAGLPYAGEVPLAPLVMPAEEEMGSEQRPKGDPHLRSTREVIGYYIHAADGEVGHVADLLVEDEGWVIRYIAVDTRHWLPGRHVLVVPQCVTEIDWSGRQVRVGLRREKIQHSPQYDPAIPVDREHETRLYDYYGWPKYWSQR
jgi:hypothetical protein